MRTNTVRTDTQTHRHTDRHTPMTTRPCGLRRAGNNNNISKKFRKAIKLGITTLETRRLRGDLIEVFKIFKGFDDIKHTDSDGLLY